MKIIKFISKEKKQDKNQMYMDDVLFDCPSCGHNSNANFDNMIFKVIEFFCKKCGSFYKVTNPAFKKNNK